MPAFQLSIETPERVVYNGEVSSLIVPAQEGYWGVLADHAPLIANLIPGKISIKESSGRQLNLDSASKGVVEVIKNHVTILLDHLESAVITT